MIFWSLMASALAEEAPRALPWYIGENVAQVSVEATLGWDSDADPLRILQMEL